MVCVSSVRRFGSACAIAAVTVAGSTPAWAQDTSSAAESIWDGVYTEAQSERGEHQYDLHCAHCHGEELQGLDGPELIGANFLRNWMEDDLHSLFDKIYTKMPADAPGSLSPEASADLTSFVLARNGFPGGDVELTPDADRLARIQIHGQGGPAPVPNFSLVVVVGCLQRQADDAWLVVGATEPVRARDYEPTEPGTASGMEFQLMDVTYLGPDALEGQTVQVTGLLMREPERTRLNVTELAGLGASCTP